MKLFVLKQEVYEYYHIEADNQDDALEILYSGDIDPVKSDYKDVHFVRTEEIT